MHPITVLGTGDGWMENDTQQWVCLKFKVENRKVIFAFELVIPRNKF